MFAAVKRWWAERRAHRHQWIERRHNVYWIATERFCRCGAIEHRDWISTPESMGHPINDIFAWRPGPHPREAVEGPHHEVLT